MSNEKVFIVPILKTDEVTASGRVYPKEVMAKALAEAQQQIQDRRFFGFRDPESRSLADVTHLVTNLELRGKTVEATIEVLDTPHGRLMGNVMRDWASTPKASDGNFPFRFAPRGLGTVKEKPDGTSEVTEFKMDSINLVCADPYEEPWEPK